MNTSGCLYRLTFPNGKAYIGITRRGVDRRFAAHEYLSRSARGNAVHHAIAKYGADSVKIETLAIASWEYLARLETRAIEAFGTRAPNGYNLTAGGDGVREPDAITRKKMGAGQRGIPRDELVRAKISDGLKGRTVSAMTRGRIGAAHKGKTISDEARAKISASLTGKKQSAETIAKRVVANTGKVRSVEHCEKMSAINTGREVSSETRAKISASLMGNKINKGRVQSAETRAKISAALRGRSI